MNFFSRSCLFLFLSISLSACNKTVISLPKFFPVDNKSLPSVEQTNFIDNFVNESSNDWLLPETAPVIEPLDVSGEWNLSIDDSNCKLITPQTPIRLGYHARPINCKAPYSKIAYWKINGQLLHLYDSNNNILAKFYLVKKGFFHGVTFYDKIITLKR
ncbi:AprI/Inh family metalloprotease inhibitor [Bartonella sp. DGB1]|uniref:AprI/Inh family metalloprotease inhibitor n=1 Tax=Bartonella sp. DGB1 TaxID=3239807 RepID=UPI003524062C